jgi:hypothetical protein
MFLIHLSNQSVTRVACLCSQVYEYEFSLSSRPFKIERIAVGYSLETLRQQLIYPLA